MKLFGTRIAAVLRVLTRAQFGDASGSRKTTLPPRTLAMGTVIASIVGMLVAIYGMFFHADQEVRKYSMGLFGFILGYWLS